MSALVASLIYTFRNANAAVKTNNPVRGGVAIANGTKVAGAVSHSKIMKDAGHVAGKVINPLLILSCAYNVYKSDDKVKTAAKESLGLASMFAIERQLYKGKLGNYISKGSKWIMDKFTKNVKAKYFGSRILCGLAFVGTTIAGYELASKAGESAIDLIRRSNPEDVNKTYDKALNSYNPKFDSKI